jgi:hypothetical protein
MAFSANAVFSKFIEARQNALDGDWVVPSATEQFRFPRSDHSRQRGSLCIEPLSAFAATATPFALPSITSVTQYANSRMLIPYCFGLARYNSRPFE